MIPKLLTTIVFCLATGACSMMVDKNTHDYPQASKDAFIASCMANSGGQKEACSCMLAQVQERYSYGEMAELEEKIKSGQPPAEFTDFMNKTKDLCVKTGAGPIPSKSVLR